VSIAGGLIARGVEGGVSGTRFTVRAAASRLQGFSSGSDVVSNALLAGAGKTADGRIITPSAKPLDIGARDGPLAAIR